jgi:hypothetical protein
MKTLGIVALFLATAGIAFADGNGNTSTTAAGAGITVVAPIHVERVADLSFGSLVVDPNSFTPGYLTIGTDNFFNDTHLGRGTWRFTGHGHQAPSPAQFRVTGQEGYAYGFLAADFILMHPEGHTVKVTPMVGMVDKVTHGTVPATVSVGGTLLLDAAPKPGVWSGDFTVQAVYL